MLTLRISHPLHGDRVATLTQGDFTGDGVAVGRAPRNRIVLDEQVVSRLHARLTLTAGGVFIADCASTAGILLNGVRLPPSTPARVADGDLIAIGPYTIALAPAVSLAAEPEGLGLTVMAAPPVDSYMPLAVLADQEPAQWTGGELAVRVVRIIDETPDVKTFVFAAAHPTQFTYLPGQFATIEVLIDGVKTSRSYTLSSTPTRPYTLSITVKRVAAANDLPAGKVSSWLHAHLAVGDELRINGPFGDFSCARHPSPRLLLISAGSGITPMLSMARWLADSAAEADVAFVHSARSSADLICRQDLELLVVHNPRLRVVLATTRPEPGSRWTGLSGRISLDMLRLTVPDFERRTVFCCGPEGFMAGTKEMLAQAGFPMANYHEESFGAPRRPTPAATHNQSAVSPPTEFGLKALLRVDASPRAAAPVTAAAPGPHGSSATRTAIKTETLGSLHFTGSRVSLVCPPAQTVLEAGESKGIKLPFGCRIGKCGACKLVKRSGEVLADGYDDSILKAGERSKGYVLACIARPAGRVEIEA